MLVVKIGSWFFVHGYLFSALHVAWGLALPALIFIEQETD